MPARFDLAGYFDKLAEEARLRKRKLTTDSDRRSGSPCPAERLRAAARQPRRQRLPLRQQRRASSAIHARGSLTVTVDDDGPGIPAESREDVFKPFVRLDEARNLDASGTGLGLAIARDIARSHGGDITLDDSPLGGLRVVVRVPA